MIQVSSNTTGSAYTGYTYITSKQPQGYEIYADDVTGVLNVLLKDQGSTLVPIADSVGATSTSYGELPADVNDWFTLDAGGARADVTLDTYVASSGTVDRIPQWSDEQTVVDSKSIYVDENTNSLSSTKYGTDIISNGSTIKVVITDSSGGMFDSLNENLAGGLPSDSDQWYTEDPQNAGQYIQIDFGAGSVSYPIDGMVQELNGIYSIYDADGIAENGIDTDYLKTDTSTLDDLKSDILDAVINGSGSIQGLDALTGSVALDQDLNTSTSNVNESIQSVAEKHVSEGMDEFLDQTVSTTDPAYKTIDDIFKDSIEETIQELESYDPDIFSGT